MGKATHKDAHPVIALFQGMSVQDLEGAVMQKFQAQLNTLRPPNLRSVPNIEDDLSQALTCYLSLDQRRMADVVKSLILQRRKYRKSLRDGATHAEKRTFRRDLRLGQSTLSLACVVSMSPSLALTYIDSSAPSCLYPYDLVVRTSVADKDALRSRTIVTENSSLHCGSVSLGDDFYVVDEQKSAIFLSPSTEKPGYKIDLVVLRKAVPLRMISLLEWFSGSIDDAVYERRNIRPSHAGSMVQVGLNGGPRHARKIGWAKSYTKKLDKFVKIEHDLDLVGAASILWALAQAYLPEEVIKDCEAAMERENVPRMSTQNIPADCVGFRVNLEDKTYTFPLSVRAPPTAYMTKQYWAPLHTDKSYSPFTIALTVSHNKHYGQTLQDSAGETVSINVPGGDFVDAKIKVIVRQCANTLIAFRPAHIHGTTPTDAVTNHCVITNSFDDLSMVKDTLIPGVFKH